MAPNPRRVLVVLQEEPAGDALHRLALRLSVLSLSGFGLLAVVPRFAPGLASHWPLPYDPGAHGRAMVLGFVGLFVFGYLLRIVPRGRTGPLLRPSTLRVGVFAWAASGIVEGCGLPPRGGLWPWCAAALWWLTTVTWAASLGATFRSPRKAGHWYEGWIGGALVSALVLGPTIGLAHAAGLPGVLDRAAGAFLWSVLVPITVGLSARMLPPLAGLSATDRSRAETPAALVAAAGLSFIVGQLGGLPSLRLAALLVLLACVIRAFVAMGGLRSPATAPGSRPSPDDAASQLLRWTARVAWAFLGLGFAAAITAAAVESFPVLGASTFVAAQSGTVATHSVGLGFLLGMALAVAARTTPAWVREDVRWPHLRSAAAVAWSVAVSMRLAAAVQPGRTLWWSGAALALVLSLSAFWAQVGQTIRSPAAGPPRS